jgi:hypothetical protein
VLANILNNQSRRPYRTKVDSEAGITILEMVAAMMVLTVGLLGLAASIGYAVTVSNRRPQPYQHEARGCIAARTNGDSPKHGAVDLWANRQRRSRRQCRGNLELRRISHGFSTAFEESRPDGIFGTTDDFISPGRR